MEPSDMSQPLLRDALPELSAELKSLLENDDLPQLAEQIESLRLVDHCRCDSKTCATFYTVPKPEGAWGAGHENIVLDVEEGLMVVDTLNGEIVCVEILDRADIREKLLRRLP
ncbi:MAG TPA: hypothetical protein VM095_07750 [Pyrinomonadaceae bacterium]|nr:hypothetical protein [Pyrinomonadaceae bacterium]